MPSNVGVWKRKTWKTSQIYKRTFTRTRNDLEANREWNQSRTGWHRKKWKGLNNKGRPLDENLKISSSIRHFFLKRKKLDKNLPTKSIEHINCCILNSKFISKKISEKKNTRSTLFGDLYAVPDLELVGSYQSNFPYVLDILNCESNTAYYKK